jgi:calcineurin-like phosphoesterase family protein
MYEDANAQHDFINIHGHVHGSPNYPTVAKFARCVSVERTGYSPVKLIDVIEAKEGDLKYGI